MSRHGTLALAVVAVLAAAGAHPVCNLLFRCGCAWFSAADCNVHHATGPHCPWCTTRWAFPVVIAGWILVSAIAIRIVERRRKLPLTLLSGLVAWFAGVLASGALTVAVSGYPKFLWW